MSVPRNMILAGDARTQLATLPAASVDTIVTSPPYFNLRDYGVQGQLGLESRVDEYVAAMCEVCAELARVLKDTGSLFINVGDGYSRHAKYGAPAKSLLLTPERLLLALSADGWIARSKIVWAKSSAMPESVIDRVSRKHEFIYHLVKERRYFFDLDAIREPITSKGDRVRFKQPDPAYGGPITGLAHTGLAAAATREQPGHRLGKNPGDVWKCATASFRGAHFATFPTWLIERPILATCPERVCTACGTPHRRHYGPWRKTATKLKVEVGRKTERKGDFIRVVGPLGGCDCGAPTTRGIVLDPFLGAGTTGIVAQQHDRDWIGIELSATYRELAWQRLRDTETAKRVA